MNSQNYRTAFHGLKNESKRQKHEEVEEMQAALANIWHAENVIEELQSFEEKQTQQMKKVLEKKEALMIVEEQHKLLLTDFEQNP